MTNLESLTPTQDERVMAALAHVAALVPTIGIIAPIIIWITQKDKSRYVAFQSLQALAFQLSMIAGWFIGMGCYMFSVFGIMFTIPFTSASESSQAASPLVGLAFFFPFLVFGAIFIGGFLFIVYGVIGAIMAFQGKPFQYMIIGKRIERFMQPTQNEVANP